VATEGAHAACVASDHCLDAFVSALVAAAAAFDNTILPAPEEVGTTRLEGWIHLPKTGSLNSLGTARI